MPDDPKHTPEPRGDGGDDRPPKPPVRMSRSAFSWILIAGLALILLVMFNQGRGSGEKIDIDVFWNYVSNGKIKELTARDDVIIGKFKDPQSDLPNNTDTFECRYPRVA